MGVVKLPIAGVLVLAVLVAPRRSGAQAPQLRADLEEFRARLSAIDDPSHLRELEHQFGSAGATAETEAIRRLHRGHVRLRIGALGDGWSYGRAAGDFGRATELEPGWSDAWQARGLALRAESEWQASDRLNLGKRVGFGPLEGAVESFARAIEEDPANISAARALYDGAALLRDSARFAGVVLPALRRATAAGTADTSVFLALGRTERLMGDPAAASAAFRRYLALGGSSGLGLRELAWSAFLAGDPSADSAYYAAASLEDSAGVRCIREDLALIADENALVEFDQARGSERAAFLRRFWTDRDRQALRTPGERLREHYRRITAAERRFGLEVNRRHFSDSDVYRSGSTRFDDRGIVYIRQGEPDERASTVTFGIQPNETWLYHRADGDLLLNFAANAGGDIRDYRLIPSVAAIGGVDLSRPGEAAVFFAFNDRCAIYAPLCKYLGWGPYGRKRILEDERALVRASTELAVSTDGQSLRFPRQLEAAALALVVGRQGDLQLMHLAFQVAGQATDRLPEPAMQGGPLRVRVNLFDDAGHSMAWVDTTCVVQLYGRDLAGDRRDGVGRVQLAVPSGRWRYRVAFAYDDSTGRVLPTDSVVVGRFDGSRLEVSDLVLSKGGEGVPWVPAEGDTAYFNPGSRWARSDTIALYHEIYGLAAGTSYGAKLVVRRGRRVALTSSWQGEAAGEVTRVSRTLSLATLSPGDYQLEVEVSRSDGVTARSGRRITITK
jgi:GWxTD domain-containing protein